jgi:hypothetical protein
MRLGKALKIVMSKWNVTGGHLSQVSGVQRTTIAKLLRGEHKSASWDCVQQLANGFEKIDPMAKASFFKLLELSDDLYPEFSDNNALFFEREKPDHIAAVIQGLNKLGVIDRKALKELLVDPPYTLRDKALSIEQMTSIEMQTIRGKKKKDDEETES